MTRIGLIIYIEDPKEVLYGSRLYREDTKVKETTVADM